MHEPRCLISILITRSDKPTRRIDFECPSIDAMKLSSVSEERSFDNEATYAPVERVPKFVGDGIKPSIASERERSEYQTVDGDV